jgi:hypothetical protein
MESWKKKQIMLPHSSACGHFFCGLIKRWSKVPPRTWCCIVMAVVVEWRHRLNAHITALSRISTPISHAAYHPCHSWSHIQHSVFACPSHFCLQYGAKWMEQWFWRVPLTSKIKAAWQIFMASHPRSIFHMCNILKMVCGTLCISFKWIGRRQNREFWNRIC